MRIRGFEMLLAIAIAGCGTTTPDGIGGDGIGTDPAANAVCAGCHSDIGQRWEQVSSHSLLLDCRACHEARGSSGPGHATTGDCATCHSAASHPAAAACSTCHDPHGTVNAFLVRDRLDLADGTVVDIRLAAPEGDTADGLTHASVPGAAGTGICEVCHDTTRYYPRSGTGDAHATGWCITCHSHDVAFAPSSP